MLARWWLKMLQARLQQHVNWELPDVQAEFRKGGGIRDQIANICRIIEKAREFPKNFSFIDYPKAFDCVDHNKLWKTLKAVGIPDHLICLRNLYVDLEITVRTLHGTTTGSKLGKEYDKAVYCHPCHPAYLTYMQSTSCKMLGWINHKWESRLPAEISITSDMQMIPL